MASSDSMVIKIKSISILRTNQTYNEKNQLTKQAWQMGGAAYGESYTYNSSDGSLNTMTTGVGTTLTMGYDGLRRLTSVTGGPVARKYTYRDISGSQTTMQVASVTSGGNTYSYTYDKAQKQLEHYLSVITKFRNVCAHGERLFAYQTRNDIPDTLLHQKLNIPKNGTQYSFGKHDLFAVVIGFRYLLTNDDFKRFKASLTRIIQHYLKSSGAMSESNLYQYMGFPTNWSKITSLKK